MTKLTLNHDQFNTITRCRQMLGIKDDFKPNCLVGEGTRSIENLCNYFTEDVEAVSNAVNTFNYAFFDRDVSTMVEALKQMCLALGEVLDDAKTLEEYAQNTLAAFSEFSEDLGYTMHYSDEEIRALIAQHFDTDTTMSIGYNDGRFAILFCELNENDEEEPPYFVEVIATGKKECYDKVRLYVESLIEGEVTYEI